MRAWTAMMAVALAVTTWTLGLGVATPAAGQAPTTYEVVTDDVEPVAQAPTGRHALPRDYFLLHLAGDDTDFKYVPGSLDRAANLQTRLELTARLYRKWVEVDIDPDVYVLTREKWEENRYPEPYGVPLRVGARGLVVPALGDPGTVELWKGLLDDHLPVIEGFLFRGTPEEAGSMVLADVLVQRAAGEMLVDGLRFEVEQPWMRELAVHIAALAISAKIEPGRLPVLDDLYSVLGRDYAPRSRSVRDFTPDAPLVDWLAFQTQFYIGARMVLAEVDPKDAVQSFKGMAKKGNGAITLDALLKRHKGLRDWLQQRFSAVSMLPRP